MSHGQGCAEVELVQPRTCCLSAPTLTPLGIDKEISFRSAVLFQVLHGAGLSHIHGADEAQPHTLSDLR